MAQLTAREAKIINAVVAVLKEHPGLDAEFVQQDVVPPFSGYLRMFGEWGSTQRLVQVAWRITPQQGQLLVFQLQAFKEQQPLLLADYVPESLANQLRQHHIDYLDTIGNGSVCAPPLFYEISGRRKKSPKLLPNRSQQSSGCKIIYQLLQDETLCAQPYRTIASRAQVALGAVGPVIKELCAKQLLVEDGVKRYIAHPVALRQLWEVSYLTRLRPKLQVERCTISAPWDIDSLPMLIKKQKLEDQVLIGGELAASFFCENVIAHTATLHFEAENALKHMLRLRLTPCSDGPIIIVQQFATNSGFAQRSPEGLQLADPRLVRCELLYSEQSQQLELAAQMEQIYLSSPTVS